MVGRVAVVVAAAGELSVAGAHVQTILHLHLPPPSSTFPSRECCCAEKPCAAVAGSGASPVWVASGKEKKQRGNERPREFTRQKPEFGCGLDGGMGVNQPGVMRGLVRMEEGL